MRSDEKPRIARLSRTVHVASSAGTAPPIGATCEGPLQQVRHSATVPVWRCWRWSFTVCREGRNTAAMTGLAVLRSWQFPTLRTCEIGHLRNATTPRLAVLIVFDDFFSRGSPGNADWEGRKADSIGIGPVHLEWTIVDGGEKMRVPAKPRRLPRGPSLTAYSPRTGGP